MESNSNKTTRSCVTFPKSLRPTRKHAYKPKQSKRNDRSGQASVEYAVVLVGFLALIP